MTHHSFSNDIPFDGNVSINNLHACVAQVQIDGVRAVSEIFRRNGVRHCLVGGLAVACNGYPRCTDNLDFLVGECAFHSRDGILYVRPELPIKYKGIRINWVTANSFELPIVERYLVVPDGGQVPIMPVEPLIVMKLIAQRHKDHADIVELLKRQPGDKIKAIEAFVLEMLPSQVRTFGELVKCAENER